MAVRDRAKALRKTMTDAERRLWFHLRGHRFAGCKFRRQQPLGRFVVDFVAFAHRLVIEVDGSQHLDDEADVERDRWLEEQGFCVLRFWNDEVLTNTDAVLTRILDVLADRSALAQFSSAMATAGDFPHGFSTTPP